MREEPQVVIECFGPPPPKWKVNRLHEVVKVGLRRYLKENRGAFTDLDPYLARRAGDTPGEAEAVTARVLELVAGALVFGATQALEVDAIYEVVLPSALPETRAERASYLAERLAELRLMAAEVGQMEARLRAQQGRDG